MLIDDVKITVISGNGGEGAHTFMGFRKGARVGPTGGDGGRGGSVYFLASNNVSDLSKFQFAKEVKADSGSKGMSKNHNGKNAADITVLLPLGTKIIEKATGKEYEVNDMNNPILIARGGEGELGSFRLAKGDRQTTNRGGEVKTLHMILSLIADVGLIGLPNAGKSSLLEKLTNANPKIGNYPFTTLEPNLGTINKLVLADIPGLIEGASRGLGLGTKFLKHIEKTKILVHCISVEDLDPIKSYQTVRAEFKEHNPNLLKKKEIILLTKKDLISEKELKEKIKLFEDKKLDTFGVSVFDENSLDQLRSTLSTKA